MSDNMDAVFEALSPQRRLEIKNQMEARVRQDNEFRDSLIVEAANAKLSRLYALMLEDAQSKQGGMELNDHTKAKVWMQARQALGMKD